ncbi:hypothetical protein FCM35_KLT09094 [Carex littledalei]|uniref:Uncharacterized protein n=1 Tax=Carex littledalei TaxID=544730 RepID=A0A833QVR7_9POAL|nr:hypothetical protein FCM35_KLT09094 [Carex littledalei]
MAFCTDPIGSSSRVKEAEKVNIDAPYQSFQLVYVEGKISDHKFLVTYLLGMILESETGHWF